MTIWPSSGAVGTKVTVIGQGFVVTRARPRLTWDGLTAGMPTISIKHGTFKATFTVPKSFSSDRTSRRSR